MTKKLLIVGGCSNSDSNYTPYSERDIQCWPEIVAKELDMNLLNVAKLGVGNDYVANTVTDAVLDNLSRDITVMVLWAAPNRLNFFDFEDYIFPIDINLENSHRSLLEKYSAHAYSDLYEFDQAVLNYNLRAIWRLNDFLESRSIKFYQASAYAAHGNIFRMHHAEEISKEREKVIINSVPHNKYFSKKYYTTQHWRKNMLWMENSDMMIEDDGHPNQKGHNWIAETFLLQVQSKLIPNSGTDKQTEFIYD